MKTKLLCLLFSTLIFAAAQGDLWLDEIWSLVFAMSVDSPLDFFGRIPHDNNHPLNSLFLYLLGDQEILFSYRLLAVFSGAASLWLIRWFAEAEWGEAEAFVSVAMAGSSYPLLLYFSEARGYAPAIFFCLLAFTAWRRGLDRGEWWLPSLFWVSSVLGVLSHATALMPVSAFALAGLTHELRTNDSLAQTIPRFLKFHLPPLAFLLGWYVFFLRKIFFGGGAIYETRLVIGRASALLLGLPDAPGFREVAIGVSLGLVVCGCWVLARENRTLAVFFASALVLSPALMLFLSNPKFLYFRYFVVGFPFFFLLVARWVCLSYRSLPAMTRWVPVTLVVLILTGQVCRDFRLVTLGRGQYSAAVQYLGEQSSQGEIWVGTDHFFRNSVVLRYYAARVGLAGELRLIEEQDWAEHEPEWIFTHSQDPGHQPPERFGVAAVGNSRLLKTFGFARDSGWSWFVYRREDQI